MDISFDELKESAEQGLASDKTITQSEMNTHFLNLAKHDALTSIRTNDTIKERLTAALLSKVDEMDGDKLLDCIERLDGSKVIASYQQMCNLMTK